MVNNTQNYPVDVPALIEKIEEIIHCVERQDSTHAELLSAIQPHYQESARQLLHYLALRTYDLRTFQRQLSSLSISSISHSEGYTLTNIKNSLLLLKLLHGDKIDTPVAHVEQHANYQNSIEQLRQNTDKLLGACSRPGLPRIMVTLSTEAASDYSLLKDLLLAGMDIARINTAHGRQEVWRGMVDNIREAERKIGKRCMIYMDVAGPKLRTGKIKEPAGWHKEKKKKRKNGPFITLCRGDLLQVFKASITGEPARVNAAGNVVQLARISTTLPQIFDDIQVGDMVFFDDGKMGGRILEVGDEHFTVQIQYAAIKGSRLRANKGMNLPNTALKLPALTREDYQNLPFIAKHADMVGYSFVRTPEDVHILQKALTTLDRQDLGIILKIETREAFDNLPMLLLTAMQSSQVGVMIARGDLAVEIGFERIAEVQDEILWICGAARIPAIWATQVLETMAKKGLATRAEITDAAYATRAECVMLNKGPCIREAIVTLDNILRRMSGHRLKQKGELRPLNVAQRFFATR